MNTIFMELKFLNQADQNIIVESNFEGVTLRYEECGLKQNNTIYLNSEDVNKLIEMLNRAKKDQIQRDKTCKS